MMLSSRNVVVWCLFITFVVVAALAAGAGNIEKSMIDVAEDTVRQLLLNETTGNETTGTSPPSVELQEPDADDSPPAETESESSWSLDDACTFLNNITDMINSTDCQCGLKGLGVQMTCSSEEKCVKNDTICYEITAEGSGSLTLTGAIDTSFTTCYKFVKGLKSTNCVTFDQTSTWSFSEGTTVTDSCTATVNGQTCNSCNRTVCMADGAVGQIEIDCDNWYSQATSDGCESVDGYLQAAGVQASGNPSSSGVAPSVHAAAVLVMTVWIVKFFFS